jgi:hypothetical protein
MNKKLGFALLAAFTLQANVTSAAVKNALDEPSLGLYPTNKFRLADGRCADCATAPQALWYFKGEPIAVAAASAEIAGFSLTEQAQADIKHWAPTAEAEDLQTLPPLIWLGSSKVVTEARLSADHQQIKTADGQTLQFDVIPKISTNLSYLDATSWSFFAQRPLRLRGEMRDKETFIARTIWPLDYKLAQDAPKPLQAGETLKQLVEAEHGGAKSAFSSRVLWQRDPAAKGDGQNMSVVGLMLNGAQGDDDEAHGGHFGVVTGRYSADGDWSQWLVNNFYNLDSFSEKGIVAGVTPMDKYLMDTNNGQSYYRPSYMLVAVMKHDSAANQYQAAVNRVYNHFYRHDFVYEHAAANCSGISIDTFRTLGWQVPTRGVEGRLKAIAAWFYVAISEGSLQSGRKIYDYLTTETTRLYPAVAFDAMGEDLLALAQNKLTRPLTPYEKQMAEDIEAIVYVRIPQIPSSRAFGLAPVYSFDQYMQQTPADHSQWKVVPTEPRPFPDELRSGLALEHNDNFPIPLPVAITGIFMIGIVVMLTRWIKRRWFSAPPLLPAI